MLFSIITVCFNSAKTIRQTFDSVLKQECTDYEYIVVDGASADGTVDIIKEYEPKFAGRMRWISEPDNGIYDAMNKGIKLSRGNYLNFLNADDYYEPDTLEILRQAITAHPGFDVYYGITRCFDQAGEICIRRESHTRLPWQHIDHQSMWYRRSVFKSFGLYDTGYRVAADFHHQVGLFQNSYSFCPIDKLVVNYCFGGYSARNLRVLREETRRIYHHYGYWSNSEYLKDLIKEKLQNLLSGLKTLLRNIKSLFQH